MNLIGSIRPKIFLNKFYSKIFLSGVAIAIAGIPYFCLPLNERPKAHYQRPKVLKVDLGRRAKNIFWWLPYRVYCLTSFYSFEQILGFGLIWKEWIYEIFEESIESPKREYTCERKICICLQIKKHTHDVLYLSSNSSEDIL